MSEARFWIVPSLKTPDRNTLLHLLAKTFLKVSTIRTAYFYHHM